MTTLMARKEHLCGQSTDVRMSVEETCENWTLRADPRRSEPQWPPHLWLAKNRLRNENDLFSRSPHENKTVASLNFRRPLLRYDGSDTCHSICTGASTGRICSPSGFFFHLLRSPPPPVTYSIPRACRHTDRSLVKQAFSVLKFHSLCSEPSMLAHMLQYRHRGNRDGRNRRDETHEGPLSLVQHLGHKPRSRGVQSRCRHMHTRISHSIG